MLDLAKPGIIYEVTLQVWLTSGNSYKKHQSGNYCPNHSTKDKQRPGSTLTNQRTFILIFISHLYPIISYTMFLPYMSPKIVLPSKALTSTPRLRASRSLQ
jgi:hypothetical protein